MRRNEILISREEYVLKRIKSATNHFIIKNENLNPDLLKGLIDQWEFDYDMEKAYRPEVLMKEVSHD